MEGFVNFLTLVLFIAMVVWVIVSLRNGNLGQTIGVILVGCFLIGYIQTESLRNGVNKGVGAAVEEAINLITQ